ncbi:hypothetical protein PSR1_02229 [Anaeromyxobacter sp. PSR-1]|nr:hypothetical protein PSR1_02229 [Anaeromyxobacter sp. PSR-1]
MALAGATVMASRIGVVPGASCRVICVLPENAGMPAHACCTSPDCSVKTMNWVATSVRPVTTVVRTCVTGSKTLEAMRESCFARRYSQASSSVTYTGV